MFVERLAAAPVTCLTGDQSGEWLEEQLDLKPEIGLEAAEKNPKWIWNEPEKALKMVWKEFKKAKTTPIVLKSLVDPNLAIWKKTKNWAILDLYPNYLPNDLWIFYKVSNFSCPHCLRPGKLPEVEQKGKAPATNQLYRPA